MNGYRYGNMIGQTMSQFMKLAAAPSQLSSSGTTLPSRA